jgi:hypothetical protein
MDSPSDAVIRRDATCSSIANGTHTVVVGACTANADTIEFSRYSSAGPSRNGRREQWPDLVATADQSVSLPGVLAAGTRSGVRVRMNGTSVAAPQVARQIIGLFLPAAAVRREKASPPQPHGALLDHVVRTPEGIAPSRAGRGRLDPGQPPAASYEQGVAGAAAPEPHSPLQSLALLPTAKAAPRAERPVARPIIVSPGAMAVPPEAH